MHCYRCNLYWDVKDNPPGCLTENELPPVNVGTVGHVDRRKTAISQAVEKATDNSTEQLSHEEIREKFKDI